MVKNEHWNIISQGYDCVKGKVGCGDPGSVWSSNRVSPTLLSPEFLGAWRFHSQAVLSALPCAQTFGSQIQGCGKGQGKGAA